MLTLVGIHLILPFTPVNTHPETRILVASLILGVLFLTLVIASYRKPQSSFVTALVVLLIVYAVSAISGASPIAEGLAIKVLFVAGLVYGVMGARSVAHEDV